MDYEKKYNEALEKARIINSGKYVDIPVEDTVLEYIFPELKESEDERIRKHLIKHFGNKTKKDWNGVPVHSILTWLEKQGEQKSIEWSEEDICNIENIDSILFYDKSLPEDTCVRLRNWLKSVKQRLGWKPSKEQMKALHDLNLTGKISYAGQGQVLIELYNDLKKLKGE